MLITKQASSPYPHGEENELKVREITSSEATRYVDEFDRSITHPFGMVARNNTNGDPAPERSMCLAAFTAKPWRECCGHVCVPVWGSRKARKDAVDRQLCGRAQARARHPTRRPSPVRHVYPPK